LCTIIKVRKIIYTALAESIIRYGLEGWGFASDTHLRNIYIVQRKILKLLTNGNENKYFKEL
jgi:hypothetical protein